MYIVIIIIAFAILISIAAGCFLMAFVRKYQPFVDDIDAPENEFLKDYYDIVKDGMKYIETAEHKWVRTKSFDGLCLAARYYPKENSDTTVILFHGYRSSAKRDFSCAVKMYSDLGLNVLLVDQRSHGKSEGKLICFGVKERRDVLSWIDFVLKNYGERTKIFLGGMSMGATTVLLSAGLNLPKNVKGIIADCGFTSPVEIIAKVAKQHFRVKGNVLIPIMSLFCRIFGHFGIYGISTVDSLKKSNVPVLLFHGESDDFVPVEMSRKNYESAACEKEIHTVPNASHGFSYFLDTKGVISKVNSFVNRNK